MAENIEREALLHDIEQSVVYTAREKITSAEMRGAHKVIERIKCAPAVHEPTKSEFKRMAVQMGYEPVVRCKDCRHFDRAEFNYKGFKICPASGMDVTPEDYCSDADRKDDNAT